MAHITMPTCTKQKFLLWTRFHHIQHIKEVLDCFRVGLLLLVLLLLLLLVCVCFFIISQVTLGVI